MSTERVWSTPTRTVGQLREALAKLDDHVQVCVAAESMRWPVHVLVCPTEDLVELGTSEYAATEAP